LDCYFVSSLGDRSMGGSTAWIRRFVTVGLTLSMLAVGLAPIAGALTGKTCYTGDAAFEPTIGSTGEGTLFMQSSGDGSASQRIVRSLSPCEAWTDVTFTTPGPTEQTVPVFSNDPFVHVDEATNRVFNLDMQGLQCNWLSYSDDFGESWLANPVACGQMIGLQDHPNVFTGPPGPDAPVADELATSAGYENVVYVCTSRIVAEAACARSLDGGQTFTPASEFITGPEQAATGPTGDGCLSGLTAHGTTGPDGVIYVGTAEDWTSCQGRANPAVAVSTDDGLTWDLEFLAADRPVRSHETSVAVDEAGNAYATWIDVHDRRPRLQVSTDRGQTWSSPIDLAPDEVAAASFPTVDADGPGEVAIAYYGNQAQATGSPPEDAEVPDGAPWNGYVTVIDDAHTSDPSFATATVNPEDDPIARGACDEGNRCDGVGDFLDVTIGGQGQPWAAMVDVCNDDCVTDASTGNKGARGFVGTVENVDGSAVPVAGSTLGLDS